MSDTSDSLLANLKLLCERIAKGDYGELDELFAMTNSDTIPPVIGELAESFASMAVQIEAREFRLGGTLDELKETNRQLEDASGNCRPRTSNLRDQVQRLRIEIDTTRKDHEVSRDRRNRLFPGAPEAEPARCGCVIVPD